jgi:iduronate 2-sulfatase
MRYRKATLWAESTRAPLMIRLPGMTEAQDCLHAVNLLDLHPTLIDLCGLPERPQVDGRSLSALLENPTQEWPYPTVTTQGYGNHSVVYEDWHYIQRKDGTNELYHLKSDPLEHKNLIRSDHPVAAQIMSQLKSFVPKDLAPELPRNESHLSKEGLDMTLKAKRNLAVLK